MQKESYLLSYVYLCIPPSTQSYRCLYKANGPYPREKRFHCHLEFFWTIMTKLQIGASQNEQKIGQYFLHFFSLKWTATMY